MKNAYLQFAPLALVALTFIVGCAGWLCEPSQPTSRDDYTPHASVTLGHASIDSPAPAPTPAPSNGKCKNCKGVGKVGDGRTMLTCDVCKGTGKDTKPAADSGPKNEPIADPEAMAVPTLPIESIKPTITLFTRANCPPCDRWKVNEAPQFRKAGWTIVEQIAQSGFTPRFEVIDSKRSFGHTGYMTVAQFNAAYFSTGN